MKAYLHSIDAHGSIQMQVKSLLSLCRSWGTSEAQVGAAGVSSLVPATSISPSEFRGSMQSFSLIFEASLDD